jgi:hypothetical protein
VWRGLSVAASTGHTSRIDVDVIGICRNAIDVLRRLGWTQGHYISGDGPPDHGRVCLVEALSRGSGLPPEAMMPGARSRVEGADRGAAARYAVVDAALEVLAQKLGRDPLDDATSPRGWLIRWNDASGRTLEHVLAALSVGDDE